MAFKNEQTPTYLGMYTDVSECCYEITNINIYEYDIAQEFNKWTIQ